MGDQPTGYSEQYEWGTSLLAIVSSMGGDQSTGYSEQYGWGASLLAIVSSMGGGPVYWL